jgi:peptidoglycan/xylan/chitin deacetylase (PgdA/CDA1 family)
MILTADIEYLDDTEDEILNLLDLLKDHDATATFFVVTDKISSHKSLIRQISRRNEIASHSVTHRNLSKLSPEEVFAEISESKREIDSLGMQCLGFRAPYNMPPLDIAVHLKKAGYRYDASLSSVYFPFRYNNRTIPNTPYNASNRDIRKKGAGIIEMPVSNFTLFKLPSLLSFLKVIYPAIIPFEIGGRVFTMHDYDLRKGVFDANARKPIQFLQQIRSGKKAQYILESFLKKQSYVCSCHDFLEQHMN